MNSELHKEVTKRIMSCEVSADFDARHEGFLANKNNQPENPYPRFTKYKSTNESHMLGRE